MKVISFLTSDYVDDKLLTKSEANVFAGETFDIDFKAFSVSPDHPLFCLFTLALLLYILLH